VLPDGSLVEGALGGSGPQCAWGYAAAASILASTFRRPPPHPPRLAIAAGVGPDLPAPASAWLAALGADARGLAGADATPRAWQRCGADGVRVQEWRGGRAPLAETLLPPVAALDAALVAARAHHAGVDPLNPAHASWLRALRAVAPPPTRLTAETFQEAARRPTAAELASTLAPVDRFSPNAREAASLVGSDGGVRGVLGRLLAAGDCGEIVLRSGADGATLARPSGPAWTAPAVAHLTLIDDTGCGNAFLGALAAGDAARADAATALAVATAVAAAVAEAAGVPDAPPDGALLRLAGERAVWVRGRVVAGGAAPA